MTHTPGPWVHSRRRVIFGGDEFSGAIEMRSEADARLIAAAPDMYAALVAVTELRGFEPDEPYGIAIRSVLAKAEGRS